MEMSASMPVNPEQEIASYYTHGSLLSTILGALQRVGVDPEHPSADQLASLDEFHTGGREATVEFAGQMGITSGMRLLDVGCGIGGPARYFADRHGCRVTGIDLSAEFCAAAKDLSARACLSDRTEFRQGSALSLPVDDATFDGAYLLHVGMNISAKADAFREIARVLKPGSVFGIFDVMREGAGDLAFPLPWASGPGTSFVETAQTYTDLLREAGFAIEKQRSRRDFALAFFARLRAAVDAAVASGAPPPLGPSVLMGPAAPAKIGNLLNAIERGLLSPTEIVSRKL